MLNTIFTPDRPNALEAEAAGLDGPTIIGLDLAEKLRLVVVATREDCPIPVAIEHQKFRSKEGLQRYLATQALDGNRIVALSSQYPDTHGIVAWLSRQDVTVDWHAHPGWSSSILKLKEERAFWSIPRSYDTAYALAFLSSYRRQAERTACRLWNQTYCLDEILTEFKVELERLSHALQPKGLLESQKRGLCPF
jgi:hypothetical protein